MHKRKIVNSILIMCSAAAAVISSCFITACSKSSNASRNHKHTMQFIHSTQATCTERGIMAHWHCADCGGNFLEATAETRLDNVSTPTLNHVFYGEYGYDEHMHYHECYNCGYINESSTAEHIIRRVADENTHHSECYCGYTTEPENHTLNADGICTVCGYGGIIYTLADSGKYYICAGVSNAYKNSVEEVEILDQYEGKPVKEIASRAFFGCESLKKVHFGRNIVTMNDYAFYSCKNLTDVTLNSGLAIIGASAFEECANLEELTLPSTVMQINTHAFSRTGLKEAVVPANVSTITANLYYGCDSLEKIVLPQNVSEIRLAAFARTEITELVIPDSVTAIPMTMCLDCISLKTVTIPAGVTAINAAAFSGCVNLETVIFKGTEQQWNALVFNNYPQEWDYKAGSATEAGTYKVVFGG